MKVLRITKLKCVSALGKCLISRKINFTDLENREKIYLYAGNIPDNGKYEKYIGLSLEKNDSRHIKHDVTQPIPLKDSCVDVYQSEDVFEHIDKEKLPLIINEIYRVLKKGGVFRLSLPDYRCDVLYKRTEKNEKGELIFDPLGGGKYINGRVIDGGHLWFPTYEQVKDILEKTRFKHFNYYHYYNESGEPITKPIDYSIGYVRRTPDNDRRVKDPYRPMSIVVDCIK